MDVVTRAADRAAAAVAAIPMHERGVEVGRGEGGDTTLVIDRDAEAAIVATLEDAASTGLTCDLVSEELGTRSLGGGAVVVVDPIDGSRNARRGLPDVAISIAVADGPTLADVRVALLHHIGTGERVLAVRGEGVQIDGHPMRERPYRGLWLVTAEGASPKRLEAAMPHLRHVSRIRSLGSLALSMEYVALGRLDGLVVLRPGRIVDIAAATLIAREAGVLVNDLHGNPLDAPLTMDWRGAFSIARVPDDVDVLVAATAAGNAAGRRG